MGKKIGILGSGAVGKVLAAGAMEHGYDVMIGTRDAGKMAEWLAEHPAGRAGTPKETAEWADLIILATKGSAAEAAIRMCDSQDLAGKTVIDATNPIADTAPDHGVLHYFTTLEESLMERLQQVNPKAHFVKAFNSVGNALMVNPDFGGARATMFICGNDSGAKAETTELLDRFGWDAEDMVGVEAARAIEPLCMLWCIPGFARNQWNHAFKLVRSVVK